VPVKLSDVAGRAGVHSATASRALNPKTRPMVSRATAARVLKAARELGYEPNPFARSLKTARSLTVGVVIPDLTNPLFPPIVRGIEDALNKEGYSALIVNTDNDPDQEERLVASLRGRQVDGFIFATARLSHPVLSQLAADGVAAVLVNRQLADAAFPAVTVDDAAGITMVVQHLIALGHRRIAHIAGPQTTSTGKTRRRAFLEAMASAGLPVEENLLIEASAFTEADGQLAFAALVESGREFTAVVAGNDMLAVGCYDQLRRLAMSCPGDVSIAGFNDMRFMDKLHPPLTTVSEPHYAMGAEAAKLLIELLTDSPPGPVKAVTFPPRLVIRGSTGPPRSIAGQPGTSREPTGTAASG
jgi:LacI family transcriptional regulator